MFFSNEGIEGVKKGISMCAGVIIPSLFPTLVCTFCILKTNSLSIIKPISFLTENLFGQSVECFSVMLLSFVGGYPIGANLINELYSQGKISKKTAHLMLCFCVNAGPAFIISVVGIGVWGSKQIGYALYFSHILSSILIALFCSFELKRNMKIEVKNSNLTIKYGKVLNEAIGSATDSILKISATVIFFSSINNNISMLLNNTKFMEVIFGSIEVTNGVFMVDNIYFIAFILGFSGISIWCQIITLTQDCGINYFLFIFSRILHGILNFLFFNAFVHIFDITVTTISNGKSISFSGNQGNFELSISIIVLIIFFIISVENKKRGRKVMDDLI